MQCGTRQTFYYVIVAFVFVSLMFIVYYHGAKNTNVNERIQETSNTKEPRGTLSINHNTQVIRPIKFNHLHQPTWPGHNYQHENWGEPQRFTWPRFVNFQIDSPDKGTPLSPWRPTGHKQCCSQTFSDLLQQGKDKLYHLITSADKTTQLAQVFDAIYDTRLEQVVVHGEIRVKSDKSGNEFGEPEHDIRCHLYDAAGVLIEGGAKILVVHQGLFRCAWTNRTAILPAYLGLTGADRDHPDEVFQVKWPGVDQLAVCMAPFFSEQDWVLALQFLQFYINEGVSKIFVANRHMSKETRVIIDYYKHKGWVEEQEWTNDALCEEPDDINGRCFLLWINLCTQRASHRFSYVAVVDLDELLYVNNMTLVEFVIRELGGTLKGSVTFRPRWFPRRELARPFSSAMLDHKEVLGAELPIVRWTKATMPAPPGHTVKTISKARDVLRVWVHYIQEFSVADEGGHEVDPSVGYVRHYRNYSTWGEGYIKEAEDWGGYVEMPMEPDRVDHIVDAVRTSLKEMLGYDKG